jgi:hypothetical protein
MQSQPAAPAGSAARVAAWVSTTRLAVFDHESQALGWIVGIEGHIRRARLQDRDQRHHHRQAPRDANSNSVVGPDAQTAQMVRQPVGLLI